MICTIGIFISIFGKIAKIFIAAFFAISQVSYKKYDVFFVFKNSMYYL